MQDLSEVLAPLYILISLPDKLLFNENNEFMYAVFVEDIFSNKGKSLVRHYELHWDGHKIHSELLVHAETSIKASVDSTQLLTYIATANIGDGSCRGYTEDFILHWQEHIWNIIHMLKLMTTYLTLSITLCLRIQ